jgi:bacillithiol system protein YtxJ
MRWNQLTDVEQLSKLDELSAVKPVLIYKHSTRCNISSAALGRIERTWKDENENSVTPYYLDLIQYRSVSNAIALRYNVQHESPQVLLIKQGRCVCSQTHMGINVPEILTHVAG